jgi:hypothetical protein
MGDRSPKAVQKKNSQKQAKAADADAQKKQAITSQQVPKAKASDGKKK